MLDLLAQPQSSMPYVEIGLMTVLKFYMNKLLKHAANNIKNPGLSPYAKSSDFVIDLKYRIMLRLELRYAHVFLYFVAYLTALTYLNRVSYSTLFRHCLKGFGRKRLWCNRSIGRLLCDATNLVRRKGSEGEQDSGMIKPWTTHSNAETSC
jgi:hypothetical protein